MSAAEGETQIPQGMSPEVKAIALEHNAPLKVSVGVVWGRGGAAHV